MFFLLGPESIRLYLTKGRLKRPGMRHRILLLLCWMSSWKVWLEQRLCAYNALLCHSELHNEQLARRQLKKRQLLLREVSSQAANSKEEVAKGRSPQAKECKAEVKADPSQDQFDFLNAVEQLSSLQFTPGTEVPSKD